MISSQNVVYEMTGGGGNGGNHTVSNNGGANSPGTSSMLSNSSMTRVLSNLNILLPLANSLAFKIPKKQRWRGWPNSNSEET